MKVYLATVGDQTYDNLSVVGIFSSREKAIEALKNYHIVDKFTPIEQDEICEIELDTPLPTI